MYIHLSPLQTHISPFNKCIVNTASSPKYCFGAACMCSPDNLPCSALLCVQPQASAQVSQTERD